MISEGPDIVPVRSSTSDDASHILRFAADEADKGRIALCTLVDIRGGSARPLGAHMAVAADGRFCGYVSGGCVEAAVAREAVLAIAQGQDRNVMYGEGSPFFDIVLPCGGGITVAIHVVQDAAFLHHIIERLDLRDVASIGYDIAGGRMVIEPNSQDSVLPDSDYLVLTYQPKTRLVLSGGAGEAEAVLQLATAAGYDVVQLGRLEKGEHEVIDRFTAVALLHHDIDAEERLLTAALGTEAFYIGALGSTRTHKKRLDRLADKGVPAEDARRIRGPIGIFGPTRDSMSLAISVLADIAAARLEHFGR